MKLQIAIAVLCMVVLLQADSGNAGKLGVIDGENANKGDVPWIVSLRTFSHLGFTHFCGGSIIGDQWIVTAGHCCLGKKTGTCKKIWLEIKG